MIYEIERKYKDLADSILTAYYIGIAQNSINVEEYPFEERNIAFAKIIQNSECELEGVKKAIKNMQERATSLTNYIDQLNVFMLADINGSGLLDPIKCNDITIKLQNNPPSLVIDDPELLPDIYIITKEVKSFDKMAIKKDIEAGFEVEGARIVKNKRLVIK
jgi:hypothetical protein